MTQTHDATTTGDAEAFSRCAELLRAADGLLIAAGAGMGVDAGLPDFRGAQGFWRAYPALGRAKIRFEEIANPSSFQARPRLAWGFYGHRLELYRRTEPHDGYRILLRWAQHLPNGAFVFTSNVDGLFQKAGFAQRQIEECHGSIHHLQCTQPCSEAIWPAEPFHPEVDAQQCRLMSDLPLCPHCQGLARPNILMFNDWAWLDQRSAQQAQRRKAWLAGVQRPLVIELGAGIRIATVRRVGELLGAPIIRINPAEAKLGGHRGVSLQMGALAALRGIDAMLNA